MKLLTMLVKEDRTISNAQQVFEDNKSASCENWGCKDIGIPLEKVKELVQTMKSANKQTVLEMMKDTEEECRASAHFAIECGFDKVLGGAYSKEISKLLKGENIDYYPFVGELVGNPRRLLGSVEDIVEEACRIASLDVTGITVAIYRFEGDKESLLSALVKRVQKPIVVAGSVNSKERIQELARYGISAITIGTSFFDKDFVKEGTFEDNVNKVEEWITEVDLSNKSSY